MKKAIEIKPAIGYLYPGIFNMLSGLRLFEMRPREDNASDTGIIYLSDYRSYKRELSSFRETYAQARDAIYNIFIRPEELGIHTFSMNIWLERGGDFPRHILFMIFSPVIFRLI